MNWRQIVTNVLASGGGAFGAVTGSLPEEVPVTFGTVGVPVLAVMLANLAGIFQETARRPKPPKQ